MSPELSRTLPSENIIETSQASAIETSPRVGEFWAYVAQNADILVESDRAPGYKAPFGMLMGMCAGSVTSENVDAFFNEANSMLAGAKLEVAENDEDDSKVIEVEYLEFEKFIQITNDTNQEKLIRPVKVTQKLEKPRAIEAAAKTVNKLGDPPIRVGVNKNPSSLSGSSSSNIKEATVRAEKKEAIVLPQKTKEVANLVKESFLKIITIDTPLKELADSDVIKFKQKEVNSPLPLKIEAKVLPVKVGQIPVRVEISEYAKPQPEHEDSQTPSEQNHTTPQTKSTEPSESTFEIVDKKIVSRPLDEDSVSVKGIVDQEYSTNEPHVSLENITESNLLIEQSEKEHIALIPEIQQSVSYEAMQEDSLMSIIELGLPVELVEQVVAETALRIEEVTDDNAEELHQILNLISGEVTNSQSDILDVHEKRKSIIETETRLSELFTQLFDQLELEYNNELIGAFAKLALKDDVLRPILDTQQEDDKECNISYDKGTHEVIKRLKAAILYIKKLVQYANNIGKLTLQLYSQQQSIVIGAERISA